MSKRITNNMDRRTFLKRVSTTTLILPIAHGFSLTSPVFAQSLPPADESGALAVSIDYVHDATTSSVRKDESAICKNCMLYVDNGTEWGGCSIFPANSVNVNGWCKAWSLK